MGLGQTLLTIMSLMLMGRLILSVNTTTLDVGFSKDMSEYRIAATSLGTSMIEQSNALAFDEKTVDTTITSTTQLTAAASFGPDGTETLSTFDDIDDFHNYVKLDTLQGVDYRSRTRVEYMATSPISTTLPITSLTVTTTNTYNKRITVEVTSPYLIDYSVDPPRPDTLRFQTIYSYWYFR